MSTYTNREKWYLYPRAGSIFLCTSDPRKGKYGYTITIKPLYGTFYDAKKKQKVRTKDLILDGKLIILNINEDLAKKLKKDLLVLYGIDSRQNIKVIPMNEILKKKGDGGKKK